MYCNDSKQLSFPVFPAQQHSHKHDDCEYKQIPENGLPVRRDRSVHHEQAAADTKDRHDEPLYGVLLLLSDHEHQ